VDPRQGQGSLGRREAHADEGPADPGVRVDLRDRGQRGRGRAEARRGPAVARSVWAVVVAAGSGERFGSPKQYEQLGDCRVLDWAVSNARAAASGVVLVVPADRIASPERGVDVVVAGGPTRSASVRAGLRVVPDDADVVVVHDAARPLAPASMFDAVIAAVR